MVENYGVKDSLQALAQKSTHNVVDNLSVGDKLKKVWGGQYVVDTTDIGSLIGPVSKGTVPYGRIHNVLKSDQDKIMNYFETANEVPISEVVNAGLGQCLEKAILVQLSAQTGKESYLINGFLELDEFESPSARHGYNIVFKDNSPYLIDAENPFPANEEGKSLPYIVPVLGLTGDRGNFVLPDDAKLGRNYSIF